jgi:hypothetical protein
LEKEDGRKKGRKFNKTKSEGKNPLEKREKSVYYLREERSRVTKERIQFDQKVTMI